MNNGLIQNSMGNYIPQQRNYFNTSGVSTSTNNIVWVQGIEGAKAWQLAPNSMVILLDSEIEGKMYIKVSDNIGMSSLRIFNYEEEISSANDSNNINNNVDLSQYVKKDELSLLIKEILLNDQTVSATQPTTGDAKPKVISVAKK